MYTRNERCAVFGRTKVLRSRCGSGLARTSPRLIPAAYPITSRRQSGNHDERGDQRAIKRLIGRKDAREQDGARRSITPTASGSGPQANDPRRCPPLRAPSHQEREVRRGRELRARSCRTKATRAPHVAGCSDVISCEGTERYLARGVDAKWRARRPPAANSTSRPDESALVTRRRRQVLYRFRAQCSQLVYT